MIAYVGRIFAGAFGFLAGVIAHIDENWLQLAAALSLITVSVLPAKVAPLLTAKLRVLGVFLLFFAVIVFHQV